MQRWAQPNNHPTTRLTLASFGHSWVAGSTRFLTAASLGGFDSNSLCAAHLQVVITNLTVENEVPIPLDGGSLYFTYSVRWTESHIMYEQRFRRYLDNQFFEHKVVSRGEWEGHRDIRVGREGIASNFPWSPTKSDTSYMVTNP